jgi:Fe-S cluster biogenesis protein NfuA
MREKVEAILDIIRADLKAEGGDVRLVDIKDGVVSVKLIGGCIGCSMPAMTLKYGIERTLKMELPEVKGVVRV